jgi:hypothetical protein
MYVAELELGHGRKLGRGGCSHHGGTPFYVVEPFITMVTFLR